MNRKVTFEIYANPEQKAEWKAIRAARADLDKREKALIEYVKANPKIEMARSLGGYHAPEVKIDIAKDGASFWVSFIIAEQPVDGGEVAPAAPKKPQTPRVFLDPKTLNLLLNGKMLTDEQKIALLCRMDAGLEDILQTVPAEAKT
jgi:hypothetical protein